MCFGTDQARGIFSVLEVQMFKLGRERPMFRFLSCRRDGDLQYGGSILLLSIFSHVRDFIFCIFLEYGM